MADRNNIYIEDVIDVKELQNLQDNWAKATNLAFVSVDCNGTPITEYSNFTPFCEKLREIDEFRERCHYCDACGGRKAKRIGKAYAYICHAGLIDFAIPIMIKGQYVGAILAGQVTSTDFQDLRPITPASEGWQENEELMKLYKQVAVMPAEKILAVAQILCDSYNYSVEKQYANKVDAELREKDLKLIKEEKLRIEMEKALREIELKALHYQINPHFLFNTLETIRMTALKNQDREAADSIKLLSKSMRYTLDNEGRKITTLGDELRAMEIYTRIQKMRFGERVNLETVIQPDIDVDHLPVLPLLIQPLIENAISHGLEKLTRPGLITLTVTQAKGILKIQVQDNGVGLTTDDLERLRKRVEDKDLEDSRSIGLRNVNNRIKMYYGQNYGLKITSQLNVGTTVTLFLRAPTS